MQNLFGFISLLLIVAVIIGLIKPRWVIHWGKKRGRLRVLLYYIPAILIALMLIGVTAPPPTPAELAAQNAAAQKAAAQKAATQKAAAQKAAAQKAAAKPGPVPGITIKAGSSSTSDAFLSFTGIPSGYNPKKISVTYFSTPSASLYTETYFLKQGQWQASDGSGQLSNGENGSLGLNFVEAVYRDDAQIEAMFTSTSGKILLAKSPMFNVDKLVGEESTIQTHANNPTKPEKAASQNVSSLTVGSSTSVGNYEVRLNNVSVTKSAGDVQYGLGEAAKGIYYVVNVTMRNTSNSAVSLDASQFTIVDSNGNQYSADSSATIDLNSNNVSFSYDQVNPGESETGNVAFDVPLGLKDISLKVAGGFWGVASVTFTLPNVPSQY